MNNEVFALQIENLHKSFGSNEVLKGVNCSACQGDVISLIGSSGSGKSTLLRCINLLEIPDEGRVSVNGELIHMKIAGKLRKPESIKQVNRIRSQVGMVFQDFNLWSHMTVLENIIEGPVYVLKIPKEKAIKRARKLLEKVGMSEKANSYPSKLSGGQQQRAAIARALAMEPMLLLFDEPTSALDPELVGEVLQVIRILAEEGRTMLIVTHEMSFAREVSSHVIFLHNGMIEEQGSPEEVFESPKSARCQQFLFSTLKKK